MIKRKSNPKRGYYSYSYHYKKPRKKPRKKISAVLILIILNVVIFFILMLLGFFKDPTQCSGICKIVALQPTSILEGNYLWTIITSMFAHGGFMHLFVNMLSLMFLGSFLERLIGNKKFLAIYFISGIIASLFFVLFAISPLSSIPGIGISPENFAVGASGAIFGVGGVLAILTPKVPVFIMFIPIPMPLWFGIALIFVVMWVITAAAGLPIGNAAHLGGLVAGMIFGFYLRYKYKKKVAVLDRYFK
ncbi:MAG: rhomboid family intramembrane serine protease [Candidatus Pacearchaeota archaeon]|nr:MAG: rhomboid family intramembrane serine protease [Candidatus Pacearchaeota archaeon]